ncbi:MAG: AAA family ATPase [Hyphomonadaceae bacterium]
MTNDSALFEDDFLLDLDDVEDVTADAVMPEDSASDAAEAESNVDLAAPAVATAAAMPVAMPEPEGGDAPLPAISIRVFFERPETGQLVETASADRRMARADIELIPGGVAAAIGYLTENVTPNLLIVESSLPAQEMLAQIDSLAEHCDPGVQVMVVGAMNDIALYRQLVARGVSEYLVPPITPLEFIRSVATLFVDPDKPFVGKSISVVGAKGGVGSSTIAHNLAWSISENGRLNTTLMDLDLSFGTTALDFNQEGTQSITDALLAPDRTDEAVISRLLTTATERLSLFTAPASVNEEYDVGPEAYDTVIQAVRNTVPYVVLDLPHIWSTWLRETLVASDEVILVCQPDLASLRNGKNILDRLRADRPNDMPPRLVLNMAGVPKRPEIPAKDFALAIGAEPEVVLDFDPSLFGTASNNGQMISEAQADAKASLAIDHLASLMTGQVVDAPAKSFVQKLLGK